jgi:cytoskeletal protein RodZ
MEGLGEKFQKARAARGLTLEDAGRMTKIRPAKLAEIEAEDFSAFPSLAYAKGFVLIYGKFLNVDVSPYLEAFETPDQMTVDGYSYLQDNPAPPPPKATKVVVRREPSRGGGGGGGGQRSSLLPLAIGLVILVGGFTVLKFMMDVRRVTPSAQRDANALAQATAAPAATSAPLNVAAAPKALPADGTPPPNAVAVATPPPVAVETAAPAALPQTAPATTPPLVAAATPAAAAEPEPEVRRAEPVRPEDLMQARNTAVAEAPQTGTNRFDIRPLRRTSVRVTVDNAGGASFDRVLNPTDRPVQFLGKRIAVRVSEPGAVEIRKNGKVIAPGDADIILE